MHAATDRLPSGERTVLRMTVQTPGGDAEIARRLGLSRSRVAELRLRGITLLAGRVDRENHHIRSQRSSR
jgi:hypothetical protein